MRIYYNLSTSYKMLITENQLSHNTLTIYFTNSTFGSSLHVSLTHYNTRLWVKLWYDSQTRRLITSVI